MPDKKLKILYIDFAFPYLLRDTDKLSGGAATEWLSWIEGIKSTGNEIGVFTWKGAKQFIDKNLNFDKSNIKKSYDSDPFLLFLKF